MSNIITEIIELTKKALSGSLDASDIEKQIILGMSGLSGLAMLAPIVIGAVTGAVKAAGVA